MSNLIIKCGCTPACEGTVSFLDMGDGVTQVAMDCVGGRARLSPESARAIRKHLKALAKSDRPAKPAPDITGKQVCEACEGTGVVDIEPAHAPHEWKVGDWAVLASKTAPPGSGSLAPIGAAGRVCGTGGTNGESIFIDFGDYRYWQHRSDLRPIPAPLFAVGDAVLYDGRLLTVHERRWGNVGWGRLSGQSWHYVLVGSNSDYRWVDIPESRIAPACPKCKGSGKGDAK